ncbi:MAG: VacJ family lipoprotein [Desulfovermiculus sp.]
MRSLTLFPVALFLCFMFLAGQGLAAENSLAPPGSEQAQAQDAGSDEDGDMMAELEADYGDQDGGTVADPLEPWNRLMFQVNDRLYVWVLDPAARGYAAAMPEPWRESFDNAFYNVATPVRLVNNLLQGRPVNAARELGSCVINTVFGFVGLLEPAKSIELLRPQPPDTDAGLTLGTWGLGHGFYLVLPVLGPSSLRDSVGRVGDVYLDPLDYVSSWELALGLRAEEKLNAMSLRLGQYEDMKESALDPYTAFKDGYIQYRKRALKADK